MQHHRCDTHRVTAFHVLSSNNVQGQDHAAARESFLPSQHEISQHRLQDSFRSAFTDTASGGARLDEDFHGGILGFQCVATAGELNGAIDGAQDIIPGGGAFVAR